MPGVGGMLDETAVPDPSNDTLIDSRGNELMPTLLECTIDGMPLCAGVVALVPDSSKPQRASAAELLSHVAEQLIEAGTATGIRG